MTRKRKILNCLTKWYLYKIAKDHGVSGAYRMNAGDLVDALSRKRSVKIEEILDDLPLQDLKIVCEGIGPDIRGRTKAVLIDRLLDRDGPIKPKAVKKPEQKTSVKRKKWGKMNTGTTDGFKGSVSSTTDTNNNELEMRLWAAADQLRANSSLTAQEYSRPVLGLIFLKYAEHRFTHVEKLLANETTGRRRTVSKLDYRREPIASNINKPMNLSQIIFTPLSGF